MKALVILLVIFPWSFLFGLAYLVYRRVRGQRCAAREAACITESLSEARKLWMDNCVLLSKRAEQVRTVFENSVEKNRELLQRAEDTTPTCIRPLPHECAVNGPCNGLPREEDIMQQKPLEGWRTADADYVAKMGRA